jgi:hypothetical protein
MKLFALAVAAVSARQFQRVGPPEYPAPGFINEQGGYWADQSSDQSVQRPQAPQPPQTQPPHSTQAPQIDHRTQQSRCCSDMRWTLKNGDTTWLKQSGMSRGMPVYDLTWNGKPAQMWWNYKGADNADPSTITSGMWWITPGVFDFGDGDDGFALTSNRGATRCPADPVMLWPNDWPEGVTFTCETPPQPLEEIVTCEERNVSPNGIFPDHLAGGSLACKFDELLNDLMRKQFKHVVYNQPEAVRRELDTAYSHIVDEWREMARKEECGFDSRHPTKPGIVPNCLTMCQEIDNPINEPKDFKSNLSVLATFISDNFSEGIWDLSSPPESRSYCGNKVAGMYADIAKFEPLVGKINNLGKF